MSDPLVADSDSDLDGWYHFQDCDDDDFERAPERPEDLDGKDNDCDDLVDEDFYERDTDGDGLVTIPSITTTAHHSILQTRTKTE